jgi:two-component system sensor histidine kinase TctE
MTGAISLRARLVIVILSPLLITAAFIGFWAFKDAQTRAAERFDNSLLSTALSISRDIAVTGGDALSQATRDLLRDTSGGAVFYHVYAPDGVFVTGYATPPVPPRAAGSIPEQTYYDAIYQGQTVRALRFTQVMTMDRLNGPFTFTVWQNTALRDGFVQERTRPTFLVIAALMGALAIVVWFGVRLGLYPLRDLEAAIAQRSTDDLSPIRRNIPAEVGGIVGRLNDLFGEVGETLAQKDRFISDASHQLRNPLAGVLALAEAVKGAKTPEDAKARSEDLVIAARQSSALANNLLTLERVRGAPLGSEKSVFDPQPILRDVTDDFSLLARKAKVVFSDTIPSKMSEFCGDPVMFEQAVLNLLDNALTHGGATLSEIILDVATEKEATTLTVRDNGKGIPDRDLRTAFARFGQVEPSGGTGLGLPIAAAVAEAMGGTLEASSTAKHFSVSMVIPPP